MVPEKHFTLLSLSPSIAADKTMVTTGQAKMMQRASGTGMKLTLARLVMKEIDPITPDNITFKNTIADVMLINLVTL
jgi:hypothetical protein